MPIKIKIIASVLAFYDDLYTSAVNVFAADTNISSDGYVLYKYTRNI